MLGVQARESPCAVHPNIVVQRTMGTHKSRRSHAISGLAGGEAFEMHNDSLDNGILALNMRVFNTKRDGKYVTTPQPSNSGLFSPRAVSSTVKFGTTLPVSCVSKMLAPFSELFLPLITPSTPIPLESFPGLYSGAMAMMKQRAVDKVIATGYRLCYSFISMFVKSELINVTRKSFAEIDCRAIQPRSQEHLVSIGRFFKVIEHSIYEHIDTVFNYANPTCPTPTIIKGYNVKDQGEIIVKKFNSIPDCVAIGCDAKRYDQCISKPMLEWENDIYPRYFNNPEDKKEFAKLLALQVNNKGFASFYDGEIKYTVSGCRMSGDMNTGLGNCLDMCAMMWCFLHYCGVTLFAFANNGDDGVIFISRADLHKVTRSRMKHWFRTMGFEMVMEDYVDVIEHIEFCQQHPVWDGTSWRLVRNPKVCTTKDSMNVKRFQTFSEYVGWTGAVGKCNLALTSGMPMLQDHALAMINNSLSLPERYPQEKVKAYKPSRQEAYRRKFAGAHGMDSVAVPITEDARFSFYLAFDILPDVQIEKEAEYRNVQLEYYGLDNVAPMERIPFHDYSVDCMAG